MIQHFFTDLSFKGSAAQSTVSQCSVSVIEIMDY